MRSYIRLLMAGVTSTMTFAAGPASGQAKPEEGEFAGIESVIVTAQKRDEDSQKVPITIKTLDASALQSQQIDNVADLSQAVPGFTIQRTTGLAIPFLRGMGLSSSGPWQEVPVSTYVDGVYVVNAAINQGMLNNLERVEVIKGPQGTLFGRNATGGVISYVTKDPTQASQLDVNWGYGNYDTWTGNLYGSTGLTETLAADIAFAAEDQRDGWGTNLYTGEDAHTGHNISARSKWVWEPSDALKATWISDYSEISPPEAGNASARNVYDFVTAGARHVGGFYDTYFPGESYNRYKIYGTSVNLQFDMSWASLVSISAYRASSSRQNGPDSFEIPFLANTPAVGQIAGLRTTNLGRLFNRTWTQEFQVISPPSSKIRWVGGVFILRDSSGNDIRNDTRTVLPVGVVNQRAFTEQNTESYSGFAEATLPVFSDSTRLTLGARYTSDHRSVEGYAEVNTVANPNVYTLRPGTRAADNPVPSKTWSKPTYKASLEHDLSEDKLAYFTFSTGFQSAFYTITNDANRPPLEPTTLNAYEFGLKSYFFDRKVRVNAAGFLYDLKNVVVSAYANGSQNQRNAATSRIRGLDFDLTYQPVRDLTFNAGLQLLDPKYTSYPNAIVYVPTGNVYTIAEQNVAGAQMQWTEKVMATASATYDIPSAVGEFSLSGAMTYHSGIHYDTQGLLNQPSFSLVSASIGWTSLNERWDMRLWGKNLTDEKYVGVLQSAPMVMKYTPGEPLTYGVRVGYHFN